MNKFKSTSLFAAAANAAATAPTNVIDSSDKVVALFCTALDWMFWFAIVLSIGMALVSSYMYATSNGETEKVSTATKTLTYTAIAVVVALIAKGVPLIIGSFFKVTSGLDACGS